MSAEYGEAIPILSAASLALVESHGTRRSVEVGDNLIRWGDQTNDFYVVVSGAIEIVFHGGGSEHGIARHEPGNFVGELNLVSGLRRFVSARVVEAGEVVVVSREALQELIATQPHFSDTILQALMARRALLLRTASESLRLVGSRFSPETRRIREYLTRSHVPLEWLDPDSDPSTEEQLQ